MATRTRQIAHSLAAVASVTLALNPAAGSPAYTIRTVALTGTDGPLGPGMGPGVIFDRLSGTNTDPSVVINAHGRVAFRMGLRGPGVDPSDLSATTGGGVWSDATGVLRNVFLYGQVAPGLLPYTRITTTMSGPWLLDSGPCLATTRVTNTDLRVAYPDILMIDAGAGPSIYASNIPEFPTRSSLPYSRLLYETAHPSGTIAAAASLSDFDESGLFPLSNERFVTGGPGGFTSRILGGSLAPGFTDRRFFRRTTTTEGLDWFALGPNGRFAIVSGVHETDIDCPDTGPYDFPEDCIRRRFATRPDETGLWAGDEDSLSLIARHGEPAPGGNGARFASFEYWNLGIDAHGRTSFAAETDTPLPSGGNAGVWSEIGAGLSLVLAEGMTTPDGAWRIAEWGASLPPISVGGDGTIAITAPVTPADATSPTRDALIVLRNGLVTFVAVAGQPIPGDPASGSFLSSFSTPVVSDSGAIAFKDQGSSSGTTLYVVDSNDRVARVISHLETLEFAPGITGRPRQIFGAGLSMNRAPEQLHGGRKIINARNQIALHLQVLDTTNTLRHAIVVLEPADPCRADFDGQNGVQVADIFAFLRAWFANQPSADFDGQNGIQVADIFSFLRAWFAGCP